MASAPLGLLFSKGGIQRLIRARQAQAAAAVAALDRSLVLATDAATEPVRNRLVERFRLEPPRLDLSKLTVHPRPKAGPLESATTISVPFDGNPALFNFHPGWYPADLPRGKLRGRVLHVAVPDASGADLAEAVDLVVARIKRYLAALGQRTDEFNNSLREFIAKLILAEAALHQSAVQALGASGYRVSPRNQVAIARRTGLQFLVVATEWGSGHGGLSTFSRELCRALATEGMKVVCLVLRCSEEERKVAAADGVNLVEATRTSGLAEREALTRKPRLPDDFYPDIIVGHGRITGPAARVLKEDHFESAKRIHFVHMAPEEIEWFKLDREDDAGQRADQRTKLELELAQTADFVVTVGPRLHHRYLTDLHPLGVPAPIRLDPGFVAAGEGTASPPPGDPWRILVMGRAEDDVLKGLDLAARAVGIAAGGRSLPARLELVIRGAKEEACEGLRQRLIAWSQNSWLDVVVKPFTTNLESLDEDMKRASLILMPSKTEGFGLVGLEAIAVGVPVLISSESGLGDLLREILDPAVCSRTVIPVAEDLNRDGMVWAEAISDKLRDREASFAIAADVRDILSERKSWEASLQELLNAL